MDFPSHVSLPKGRTSLHHIASCQRTTFLTQLPFLKAGFSQLGVTSADSFSTHRNIWSYKEGNLPKESRSENSNQKKGLKSIIEVYKSCQEKSFFWSPIHHDFQHKNLCCKRQRRHLRTSAVEDEALRLGQKEWLLILWDAPLFR